MTGLKITAITCMVFFSYAPTLRGQKTHMLNLKEAIQLGLKNSFDTKHARLEKKKASEIIRENISLLYPQINLNSRYQRAILPSKISLPLIRSTEPGQEIALDFSQPRYASFIMENSIGATLSVSQSIFQWESIYATHVISIFNKFADNQLKSDESKAIKNIITGYYNVLLSKDLVSVEEQSLERAKEELKDAKRLYQQGLASDIDTLRAEAAVQDALPNLISAQRNKDISLMNLMFILALPDEDTIIVTDSLTYKVSSLDILPFDRAYKEALLANMELRILQSNLESEEAQKTIALGAYLPQVDFIASLGFNPTFNDGNPVNPSIDHLSFNVGLNVDLPVFNGFKNNAKYEQTRIRVQQANIRIIQAKKNILIKVKNQMSSIQEAIKRVKSRRKSLRSYDRIYEIAKSQWEKGITSQLELLDASLALSRAKVNLLKSIYNYLIAKTEFRYLLGRLSKKNFVQ